MIALLLVVGIAAVPLQEEPLYHERVQQLILKLDSETDDPRAVSDLSMLPASLIPMIRELASEKEHPRAARRLKELLPPAPWHRFLKGLIAHAQNNYRSLFSGKGNDYTTVIRNAACGLACLDPAEARAILDGLAADPDPVRREFATAVRLYLEPKEGAAFARMLDSPAACERGADLVILRGETAAIPRAVEIFSRGEAPESYAAARVLLAFGAGEGVNRIADLAKGKGKGPDGQALAILGRTGGPRAEEELLAALAAAAPESGAGPEIIRHLVSLNCPGAGPVIRDYIIRSATTLKRVKPRTPAYDVELAKVRLTEIRKEPREMLFMHLPELYRVAAPGLRESVLAWIRDPDVRTDEVRHLLPLLGAVGTTADLPMLREKLADARSADGAAEGLSMIGDPADSKAVWKCCAAPGVRVIPALELSAMDPPDEDIIAALKEIRLLPPQFIGYIRGRMSPAVRKALFEKYRGKDKGMGVPWDVPLLLEKAATDEERAWVDEMQNSQGPVVRLHGLFLATRSGRADAAAALAGELSRNPNYLSMSNPFSIPVWKALDSSDAVWISAVETAWKLNPAWFEASLYLARLGSKGALEQLKEDLTRFRYPFRTQALRLLAIHGDAKAREWFLDQFSRSQGLDDEDRDAVHAMATQKEFLPRLVALARASAIGGGRAPMEALATLRAPEGLPLYRWGALGGSIECLRALAHLKDPEAFPLAVRCLRGGDAGTRSECVPLIETTGGRNAIPVLLTLVDDMEAPRARPHAGGGMRILSDPLPPRPAIAAMAALERLTGVTPKERTIAERRAFWRNWDAKSGAPRK